MDVAAWSTVYIKGVNGRVQTGIYLGQRPHVVALNINRIQKNDILTVHNAWNRTASVSEIIVSETIVRLSVSTCAQNFLYHYILKNWFLSSSKFFT